MSQLHTTHKVARDNRTIAWQWNAMLNQLTMDKENVPLALDDTHKATRDEKTNVPNGQCNWTNEWLKEANGCSWENDIFIEEGKQTMKYICILSFGSFEWNDKWTKIMPIGVIIEEEDTIYLLKL